MYSWNLPKTVIKFIQANINFKIAKRLKIPPNEEIPPSFQTIKKSLHGGIYPSSWEYWAVSAGRLTSSRYC